jgi:hypothetical protein
MKLVRRLAMALTVTGALMVATAGNASAHFSQVNHYCGLSDAKMSVELVDYGKGAQITVIINGVTVTNTTFDDNYFSNFDLNHKTSNSYQIIVVAGDDASFNINRSGIFCADLPAPPTTPTTAPPVVTTAPPVVTTAPPVVTTAPPVVTTAPPVVTTAPAATTTTTIAGSSSGGPTPTVTTAPAGNSISGSTVAAAGPTPTVKSNPLLPATGSRNTIIMQLGIIAMCVGALTLILVRRPAEAS